MVKYIKEGDTIDGKPVVSINQFRSKGRTAICNLASINLPRMTRLDPDEFMEKIAIAVRMLDNVIDCNLYPSDKIKDTAEASRAIGLGVMGEMEDIATRGIVFGSKRHEEYIEDVYSLFREATIRGSSMLAEERGVYPEWRGSVWDTGLGVKMRNGYINAIAPTSSISILTGTTSSIEAVFKRMWYEENMGGTIPVTAPHLSPENYALYQTAYSIDQKLALKMNGLRTKHIDQGISMNLFVDPKSIDDIEDIAKLYSYAWKKGLKSIYYLRSEAPDADNNDVIDRSFECSGCQ
jgi:ribonucleoside-diphosphate reductase alpha chain